MKEAGTVAKTDLSEAAIQALPIEQREKIIFGRNLARLLKVKDKTQSELARAIGADRSAISLYCSGTYLPEPQRLLAICDALGVKKADLLPDRAAPAPFSLVSYSDNPLLGRLRVDTDVPMALMGDFLSLLAQAQLSVTEGASAPQKKRA